MTNFAAPPILMVAKTWEWDTIFMFTTFGWKAIIITFINTILIIVLFYKELSNINIRTTVSDREKIPFAIVSGSLYISFFSSIFWTLSSIFYEYIFAIFGSYICLSTVSR